MKDEALPFGVGGGLVAIKTLLSRDPCVHANTAIEMIDSILKEHPAAPVQEPVAWTVSGKITDWSKDFSAYQTKHYTRPVYTPPAAAVQEGRDWSLLEATQESLREHMAEIKRLKEAQPAVPDAIIEAGESPDYRDGWNDCRQAMLEILKARTA